MVFAVGAIIVLLILYCTASSKNADNQSEITGLRKNRDDMQAQLARTQKEYAELSDLVNKKLDQGIAKKIEALDAEREAVHANLVEIQAKKRDFEYELQCKEKQRLEAYERKASGVYQEAERELISARREAKDIRVAAHKEAVIAERMIATLKHHPENVTIQWVASRFSEFVDAVNEETARWLEYKRPPAKSSAAIIRAESAKRREAETLLRAIRLRCEYYERQFPFMKELIDDEKDSLVEEQYWDGPGSWEDEDDESARWLKQEEFRSKTPAERAQLALERWTRRRKKNWEAGAEYEDFIGYKYEQDGWNVEYTGILHGKEDKGRDLICKKGGVVHIVQCKRWKDTVPVRENTIAQLLGSALEYALTNNCRMRKLGVGGNPGLLLLDFSDEVIPVLVASGKLSPTAMRFADVLGVEVRIEEYDDSFPRIKCNISPNGRIYHLPFDQQYARVLLAKPGECRARTVQEAEEKGFRRAMRHFFGGGSDGQN